MSESEVSRLREQITREYEGAKAGLMGLAVVGKHEIITKRMENIQLLHEQLVPHVGVDGATEIVMTIGNEVM